MNPFIAEISMFGGNFAPRSWAFCDGQLLAISSNTALFSILGTIYGGDGRTTFALPDMRGRTPVHPGHGPGLSNYRLGQRGGTENVTLNITQIPSHNHIVEPRFSNTPGQVDPAHAYPANLGAPNAVYGTTANGNMGQATVSNTGGGQSHTNIQPFLCVNFIISLFGVYPSRN